MNSPDLMVQAVAGALVCGVIGGLIGARKKQVVSGVVWSVLLGPIGWIIAFVLPHRGTKCPHCGGVLAAKGVPKCMHCGGDVAFVWLVTPKKKKR